MKKYQSKNEMVFTFYNISEHEQTLIFNSIFLHTKVLGFKS